MSRIPIDLKYKRRLEESFRRNNTLISDFSFANLFLFREKKMITILDDDFITGIDYAKEKFLMPITKEILYDTKKLMDYFYKENCQYIYPIDVRWLDGVNQESFSRIDQRGDNDYLYTIDKLKNYPGRKLSKKRNLVKQFLEEYAATKAPLTKQNAEDAQKVLAVWQKENSEEWTDGAICKEAINLFSELDLTGTIYYIHQVPIGFILGELLIDSMYVIHFAKADIRYKGIYQYMFQNFAQGLSESVAYINMEQDLDIMGLRQAKESYQVDLFVEKWRLIPHSVAQ